MNKYLLSYIFDYTVKWNKRKALCSILSHFYFFLSIKLWEKRIEFFLLDFWKFQISWEQQNAYLINSIIFKYALFCFNNLFLLEKKKRIVSFCFLSILLTNQNSKKYSSLFLKMIELRTKLKLSLNIRKQFYHEIKSNNKNLR